MKRAIGVIALALFCIAGWRLGASLSADGVGIVLGVILGMFAGVPAAMIASVAPRRIEVTHTHYIAETVRPVQRLSVVSEQKMLRVSNNQLEVLR